MDYENSLTTVSIRPQTLDAFRRVLYEKYGQIRGHVGEEADRAIQKHIHDLRSREMDR